MQKTILTILTDASSRGSSVVETNLDKEFAVGAPWFSKISPDSLDLK